MGLLLAVFVHAANVHDSKAGMDVIALLRGRFCRLQKVFADGGYRGQLLDKVKFRFNWVIEIVLRTEKKENFEYCLKDGLLSELLLGLKATGGSAKIMNSTLLQLRL